MAKNYGVGVDFRFAKDARVIVFESNYSKRAEVADLHQMFGRGARSMSPFFGEYVVKGPTQFQTSIDQEVQNYMGPEFTGLVINLTVARTVKDMNDKDEMGLVIKAWSGKKLCTKTTDWNKHVKKVNVEQDSIPGYPKSAQKMVGKGKKNM